MIAGDGEGERGGDMADGAMVVVGVVVLVVVVRGRKLGGQLLVVVFTSDSFKSERVCYIIIIIT